MALRPQSLNQLPADTHNSTLFSLQNNAWEKCVVGFVRNLISHFEISFFNQSIRCGLVTSNVLFAHEFVRDFSQTIEGFAIALIEQRYIYLTSAAELMGIKGQRANCVVDFCDLLLVFRRAGIAIALDKFLL